MRPTAASQDLIIRGISNKAIIALHRRAFRNHRTFDEGLRAIIEEGAGTDRLNQLIARLGEKPPAAPDADPSC